MINQIGKNERILKSVFLVQTSYSVKQIRDYLMDFVDKDDGIAIFECIHFAVSNLEKAELIRYNWHD